MAKVVSVATVQKQMSDHFRDLKTQAEKGQMSGYCIAVMGDGEFADQIIVGYAGLTLEQRYELLAHLQAELNRYTIRDTIGEEYE
jgi:hypothetical protein